MAVAHDATGGPATGILVTSISSSHIVAGADRFMLIDIAWFDFDGLGGTISSVKYNGVDATFHSATASGVHHNEIWKLVAPDLGNHAVVVTWTAQVTAVVGSESYTGVDQVNPVSTAVAAAGSSTTPSVNITGTSGNNLVHDSLSVSHSTTFASRTAGPGQTKRHDGQVQEDVNLRGSGTCSEEVSTAGTVTMSYTLSASKAWRIQAVEVLEVQTVAAAIFEDIAVELGPATATVSLDTVTDIAVTMEGRTTVSLQATVNIAVTLEAAVTVHLDTTVSIAVNIASEDVIP